MTLSSLISHCSASVASSCAVSKLSSAPLLGNIPDALLHVLPAHAQFAAISQSSDYNVNVRVFYLVVLHCNPLEFCSHVLRHTFQQITRLSELEPWRKKSHVNKRIYG